MSVWIGRRCAGLVAPGVTASTALPRSVSPAVSKPSEMSLVEAEVEGIACRSSITTIFEKVILESDCDNLIKEINGNPNFITIWGR
ncbi:hypothetical protein MTR_0013s0080 [Medicago truncatula]|uniref:Uncharacterized protein n=1 Tax=Medicago truncatula TaxID=3880 RepID=A0A072TVB0_MEDTR|nr:hypothetical protein MTR_0013s0080 [Medicago truncatula]